MNTNRWTYNQCVASKITTKKELRAQFVNNIVYKADADKRWVLDTPYEVRDTAVCDLCKALKSTRELYKAGHIDSFTMRFRSKKDNQQSINVRNREYKKAAGSNAFSFVRGSFKNARVSEQIKASEALPDKIDYDARLIRTRLNEWYICIPVALDIEDATPVRELGGDSQASSSATAGAHVCALDPGVRCFQTLYDPLRAAIVEIGNGDVGRLYRLGHAADKLQCKRAKTNGHKRYAYQRAYLRISQKIRRLVDELHCKTVRFLVDNYSVVLLPSFETSQMADGRGRRRISSKAVRGMMGWAHYRFKQRLLNKAYSSGGKCKVVICKEDYTSKTCTKCGHLNDALGGAKVFVCMTCSLRIGRDSNGARNILLKNSSCFGFDVSQAQGSAETTLLGHSVTHGLAKSGQVMDVDANASN